LFLIDDNGATAIEYGLIAAGIAVAIIAIVPTIWHQAEHWHSSKISTGLN
jgi:pilus assembly protein Flp/PilA